PAEDTVGGDGPLLEQVVDDDIAHGGNSWMGVAGRGQHGTGAGREGFDDPPVEVGLAGVAQPVHVPGSGQREGPRPHPMGGAVEEELAVSAKHEVDLLGTGVAVFPAEAARRDGRPLHGLGGGVELAAAGEALPPGAPGGAVHSVDRGGTGHGTDGAEDAGRCAGRGGDRPGAREGRRRHRATPAASPASASAAALSSASVTSLTNTALPIPTGSGSRCLPSRWRTVSRRASISTSAVHRGCQAGSPSRSTTASTRSR